MKWHPVRKVSDLVSVVALSGRIFLDETAEATPEAAPLTSES